MPIGGRIVLSSTTRYKVSVRGQVVTQISMTVGRWFWKRTIPGIEVRISQEHWEALMSILRIAGVRDHDISRNIPVWGNVEQFAIGREVGVTFGYSGQLEQFFQRAIPLQLLNVVAAPTELPNEVLPSQPMLRPVA